MDADKVRGVVYVIFSVLTAVTNLVLMTTILCTRQLRLSSKYILVLVLSICDLITGLFQYSISAYLILTDQHKDDSYRYLENYSYLENALNVDLPYVLSTFRMLLFIALFIDFSLGFMIRDVKLLFKISLSMTTLSIVSSYVLVFTKVPLSSKRSVYGCSSAFLDIQRLNVLSLVPQMVVLVLFGTTILFVYSKHRTKLLKFDLANSPQSPMDICMAATIIVLFKLTQFVYIVTPVPKKNLNIVLGLYGCEPDNDILFNCMDLVDYSQTFVIPLVWLASTEIRKHFINCLCSWSLRNVVSEHEPFSLIETSLAGGEPIL